MFDASSLGLLLLFKNSTKTGNKSGGKSKIWVEERKSTRKIFLTDLYLTSTG